ncbi:hypothetical protein NIES4101_53620 [Calothrix sp. NIES-4101]|nr:hypothetical protein NIES4101_53620 [Calothrix sp. NIES-4101]
MARINRSLAASDVPTATELSENIVVTFKSGVTAEFREPTAGDIIAIRKSGVSDEYEATARIAVRCCIRWGDKEGVALPQIEKLGIKDFKALGVALNSFLEDGE